MKIALFGANGRVGNAVQRLAIERAHQVFAIDKHNCTTFDTPCDVAIDFSVAEATSNVVDYCKKHSVPLVVGTTGHNSQQQCLIDELSKVVCVVQKANFSRGIDVMTWLCKLVTSLCDWDCAIVETHRKHKLDAPSGTAKELAKATGCNDISSLRIGNQFGTHSVVFAGIDEAIEITHRATSVDVFALGAIEIAEKIAKCNKN